MANKNIIIAPKFTPFTYRELVEPIMAASKAQEEAEEKYSILDDAVSYWESLKDSKLDQDTYQTYKNFKKKFDESRSRLLNEGLNEAIRKDLMGIRSSYNSTIKPLEAAFKKREELIKEQRHNDAQNKGTLIYKKGTNASEIPLSQLVKNPAYTPDSPISGALLAQQGAEVFKNLAKEVAAGNNTVLTSLGLPYQYQTKLQMGMSSDDIIKAILHDKDANTKLTSLADMIITSSGIDKNIDPEAYNKAWNYVAPSMMNAIGGTHVGSASDSYSSSIAQANYNTKLGLDTDVLRTFLSNPNNNFDFDYIERLANRYNYELPIYDEDVHQNAMGGFMNQSEGDPPRRSVAEHNRIAIERMRRLREQRQQQNNNNNEAENSSETQLLTPTPIIRRSRSTTPKLTDEEKEALKKEKDLQEYMNGPNPNGEWVPIFGKNEEDDVVKRLKRTNEFYYEKNGKYYMSSRIAGSFKHIEESLPKDSDGYYYMYFRDQFIRNKNGTKVRRRYISKNKKDVLEALYNHPESFIVKAYKYKPNAREDNDYVWWDLLGNDDSHKYDTTPWEGGIQSKPPKMWGRTYKTVRDKPDENKWISDLNSSTYDLRELKKAGITFDDIYNNRVGTMGNKWRDYYHTDSGKVGDIYATPAFRFGLKSTPERQNAISVRELSPAMRGEIVKSVYFDGETAQWKTNENLDRGEILAGDPKFDNVYATPHGAVLEVTWKEHPESKTDPGIRTDFIKIVTGREVDDLNNKVLRLGELGQILRKGKMPLYDANGNPQKDAKGLIKFSQRPLPSKQMLEYYEVFGKLEKDIGDNAIEAIWQSGK